MQSQQQKSQNNGTVGEIQLQLQNLAEEEAHIFWERVRLLKKIASLRQVDEIEQQLALLQCDEEMDLKISRDAWEETRDQDFTFSSSTWLLNLR